MPMMTLNACCPLWIGYVLYRGWGICKDNDNDNVEMYVTVDFVR